MKRLSRIIFEYEDGNAHELNDPRAVLLFQSRCNSSGIFSGIENLLEISDRDQHISDK